MFSSLGDFDSNEKLSGSWVTKLSAKFMQSQVHTELDVALGMFLVRAGLMLPALPTSLCCCCLELAGDTLCLTFAVGSSGHQRHCERFAWKRDPKCHHLCRRG